MHKGISTSVRAFTSQYDRVLKPQSIEPMKHYTEESGTHCLKTDTEL